MENLLREKCHGINEKVFQLLKQPLLKSNYKIIRDIISRWMEKELNKVTEGKCVRENPSDWTAVFINPELHRVDSSIKQLEKLPQTPYIIAKLQFCKDIKPVADAVNNLKNNIVTRESVAATKKETEAVTYRAEEKDAAELKVTLKQVAEKEHNKIYEGFKNYFTSQNQVNIEKKISLLTEEEIEKQALSYTEEIKNFFIFRSLQKIAPVISAKKQAYTVTVVNSFGGFQTISARIRIAFADNSSFEVVHKVVYVYKYTCSSGNCVGFYRFPTTFHNAVLSSGEKVKNPSEKNIHKYFN